MLRWPAGIAAVAVLLAAQAFAQSAPLPIPYLITTVAGGGTATTANTPCSTGSPYTAYDALGDGCPATQAVLASANLQDVDVDGQGNIYIADTGNDLIRRVDANTKVITVVAGETTTSQAVCAAATDRYGDGCLASDGLANAAGAATYLGKPTSIAVAKNGDIYLAGGISLVQKISAATGMMTLVAGTATPANSKSGTAVSGYTGDNGPATSATLNVPRGVAVDSQYNVYIADYTNNVIRKVTASTGIITTIVGSSTAGKTGDGGPATAALLYGPSDIAVDSYGNVYIADTGNSRVRMIYAGGNVMGIASPVVGYIYTVAGGGSTNGTTYPYVLGTSGAISTLRRIKLDSHNNLYIADSGEIIWFLDATTGYMHPIAGTYYTGSSNPVATGCPAQTDVQGDGCPALKLAEFHRGSAGFGIAIDANENLYIADPNDASIRKVSTNLAFPAVAPASPVAQTVDLHYAVGSGPATSSPYTLGNSDYSAGTNSCTANADNTKDCIFNLTLTPTVPGVDSSVLATKDSLGNLGSLGVTGNGTVPALALDPGYATAFGGAMNLPRNAFSDHNGNLLIADTSNHRVLRYNIATQTQTILAGTGTAGYSGDGSAAASAQLNAPQSVTAGADGSIYIADTGNNVIRRVDPATAKISTYAGGATTVCPGALDALGDGCSALQAAFSVPAGVAVDARGNLYVSDSGNSRIRIVNPYQYVFAVAGGATTVCSGATDTVGDGCTPLSTQLSAPSQLRFDTAGLLYILDTGHNMVRRLNLFSFPQTMVAVAGNGQSGGSGDGGAATSAQLGAPAGFALDGANNLYIADTGNHAVRMVSSSSGIISTIAGFNGTSGQGTLPGAATATLLNAPAGIEAVGVGTLYVMDTGNSRGVAVNRNVPQFNFGTVDITRSSSIQTIALSNSGSTSASLGTPWITPAGATTEYQVLPATTNGCTAAQALVPGAYCQFTVQYIPTLTGVQTATYTLTGSTGVNSPTPVVTLSGKGAVLIKTTSVLAQSTPASGNPQYGQTTAVTVTITPASQGASPPSGTVTLQVDGTSMVPATISNSSGNGIVTITLGKLSVGNHSLVANYNGDQVYGGSTSATLIITVVKSTSAVALSASPTAIVEFQTVTFTATVTAATGGTPTGTVTFMNGSTTLGQGTLSAQGVATYTSSGANLSSVLLVGTYNVTAVYGGDSNFTSGTSSALNFVVSPDPQDYSIALSTSALAIAQGGAVQTTLTITPSNTLVGSVTFSCLGLPANAACTFQPSSQVFTLAGDVQTSNSLLAQPQTIIVTLWTNVNLGRLASNQKTPDTKSHRPGIVLAFLAPIGLLLLCRTRSIRSRFASLCLMLVAFTFGLSSCGSGVNTTANNITPGGTSTVTVQAAGPSTQLHTLPVVFTVTGN